LFWTTPAFTSRRARKNWWPTRAVNGSSGPLTRPISTRSNTSGPGSKRPCAASCPSPKTRPGQFPICVNVMIVSYNSTDMLFLKPQFIVLNNEASTYFGCVNVQLQFSLFVRSVFIVFRILNQLPDEMLLRGVKLLGKNFQRTAQVSRIPREIFAADFFDDCFGFFAVHAVAQNCNKKTTKLARREYWLISFPHPGPLRVWRGEGEKFRAVGMVRGFLRFSASLRLCVKIFPRTSIRLRTWHRLFILRSLNGSISLHCDARCRSAQVGHPRFF